MSEEVIVKYCSPTLAGIKTGSLFNCSYKSKNEVCEFLRELNISLSNKGLRFIPLRFKNKKVLIYAYRPSKLLPEVQDKEADAGSADLQRFYPADLWSVAFGRINGGKKK